MKKDTISDMLTRMRNSILTKSPKVEVPKTRLTKAMAAILLEEGWIKSLDVTFSISTQRHQNYSVIQKTGNYFLVRKRNCSVIAQKTRNYFLVLKRKKSKKKNPESNNQKKLFLPMGLKLKYYGKKKKSAITNLQCVSRPSLRIYVKRREIPQILGGLGLIILSTPIGLMTDRKARHHKLGGEVLCSIW